MDFRYRVQIGKKFTYVSNGSALHFLLLDLLYRGTDEPKPKLEDVLITVEPATEQRREWMEVQEEGKK